MYRKVAPEAPHLPEHQQKAWVYFGMFPNSVFVFMPESVQFYQEFPINVNRNGHSGRNLSPRRGNAGSGRRAICACALTAIQLRKMCA